MKTLKLNLAFFAMIIGLTSALAFNIPRQNAKFSEIWQEVDSNGNLVIGGEHHEVSDIEAAREAFQCFSDQVPCAGKVNAVDGTLQGPKIYKPN